MEKERFSLLLLEPGEIYFEDFSCTLVNLNDETLSQQGYLKMCSKSLVFDPKDSSSPIIKIRLNECKTIEQYNKRDRFLESDNLLFINTTQYVEMLSGNIVAPYVFKGSREFIFLLHYAKVPHCLPHITQLQRAATLPAAEQNAMIATIVHSRHARFKFDPLWLSSLQEKILLNMPADKISPLVINPGRVVLSTDRFYFQPYNNVESAPVIKINILDIKRIIPRRFLLRHVGLELHYLSSNLSRAHIYVAFRSSQDRDNMHKTLLEQPMLSLDKLDQDVMTLQWQNGIISNYEYLLYLNSLGDRTFNDLTQYPVFPWILTDYTSFNIDLNNPDIYRDLSKPVGELNPDRFRKLKERYEEMSSPKFMYGSHYSAPGLVIFYLVRKFPHYMLCLQNGRFDNPDRMFNSIPDVFKNCINNMSDFKELIPEFYDTEQGGSFLLNTKGINFGYRSDGSKVGDVKLPPWAKSPENFIQTLRDALESEYVSNNINHWIDLVFGYKQRGIEAEKANNLFYYLCYEGAINLDSIREVNERHALEVQIMEFGQIPKQVFTVPHPRRRNLNIPQSIGTVSCKNLSSMQIDLASYCQFPGHKDRIGGVIINDDNDTIVTVGHDSILKILSISQKKQLRSITVGSMALSSCIQLPDKNTLILSCYDDTIIFYDVQCGRISSTLRAHDDAVSVISWSGANKKLLASGSWDCSVHIWKDLHMVHEKPPKPSQNFVAELNHETQITCVTFSPDSSQLVTGTLDGELFLWETDNFSLNHRIQRHNGSVNAVSFSPDGDKLISCGDDGVFRVIDTKTKMMLFQKAVPQKLLCLVWNGAILFLGTDCHTVLIWDMIEVKLLSTVVAHQGPVLSIAMSSNNEYITTSGQDHTIKVWRIVINK